MGMKTKVKKTPSPFVEFKMLDLYNELKAKGGRVTELEKASGVSKMTLYDMINGKQVGIRFDTLGRLCVGFSAVLEREVTPNDLLKVDTSQP
jgi:DNA-binding Xre family transcriptional regulator